MCELCELLLPQCVQVWFAKLNVSFYCSLRSQVNIMLSIYSYTCVRCSWTKEYIYMYIFFFWASYNIDRKMNKATNDFLIAYLMCKITALVLGTNVSTTKTAEKLLNLRTCFLYIRERAKERIWNHILCIIAKVHVLWDALSHDKC